MSLVPDAPVAPRQLYAAGHFSRTLIWSFTDLVLGYYLHARVGLSGAQTGFLLFLSLSYSSVLDVLMAGLFLRAKDQKRIALSLQLVGGIGTALTGCLLFFPFTVDGNNTDTFALLLICSLLFRTSYAVYDVSQNALTSLLPVSDVDAVRYVSLRAIVVPVSKLCIAASVFVVIGDAPVRRAGTELAICAAIGVLIVVSATLLLRQPLALVHGSPTAALAPLFPVKHLVSMLVAAAAEIGMVGLTGRFFPFAGNAGTSGAALTFAMVGGMVAAPFAVTRLMRRQNGEQCAAVVLTVASLAGASVFLLSTTGVAAMVSAAVYGAGTGGVCVLIWRRVALIARQHAVLTGKRDDLTCFALLTGTMKLSMAVSSIMLGNLLDGFEAHGTNAIAMIVAVTVVGGLVSVAALTWVPLRVNDPQIGT